MAPVVPRELRVTYGSTVVGGTSDYYLDAGDDGRDVLQIERDFARTAVTFCVLTAGHATDAALATAVAALELAFTRPRQRLLIEQGPAFASTLLDLNPSTDTGIDVDASISKVGSPHDTGRSRRYRVRIESGNPANQTAAISGEAGLRSFRSRIVYSPSRVRTLEIEGTWTKLASATATAQYEAQIDTRVSAITTALTGTWDMVSETRRPNLEGSLVECTRTYEELALAQSQAGTDNADAARQRLSVVVDEDAPGDTGADVLRLVRVLVDYEVWVRASAGALRTWWESTGLPWVLAHAASSASVSSYALAKRNVRYDEGQRVIRASLTLLAATGGTTLARSLTTEDHVSHGREIVPAWTGDPESAYVFLGPRVVVRTTDLVETVLGHVAPSEDSGGGGGRGVIGNPGSGGIVADFGIFAIGAALELEFVGPGGAGGGGDEAGGVVAGPSPGASGYVELDAIDTYREYTIGLRGYQLPVTDRRRRTISRRITGMSAPGGGGGGGPAAGGPAAGGTRERQVEGS